MLALIWDDDKEGWRQRRPRVYFITDHTYIIIRNMIYKISIYLMCKTGVASLASWREVKKCQCNFIHRIGIMSKPMS